MPNNDISFQQYLSEINFAEGTARRTCGRLSQIIVPKLMDFMDFYGSLQFPSFINTASEYFQTQNLKTEISQVSVKFDAVVRAKFCLDFHTDFCADVRANLPLNVLAKYPPN